MEMITPYIWIAWLALILIFIIIEMLTLEFTFLMLAIGSFVGLLSGILRVEWWGQIIIAGIAGMLLILLVRPPLLRALQRGGDPTKSNMDAVVGQGGVVLETVSAGTGLVKLSNGETWTARTVADGPGTALEPGTVISVALIEGATALVRPDATPPV
ncbi:NfeD family protein [Mycetocola lacteus]|uniref:NfeD family protein n=1 Tax=Mycetocola lacteus TaxID=76637 RepID=A0A3L7ANQ6_9MICO|nr:MULTISPECIES: NfeD family protein [Mycetocola]MCS4276165.1 membrane protein implicated in regulation of membrane protease activity [Mycetocola sp. BIGb0189]RLP82089.1 NfeD family protein [Mycetocola lacteus]